MASPCRRRRSWLEHASRRRASPAPCGRGWRSAASWLTRFDRAWPQVKASIQPFLSFPFLLLSCCIMMVRAVCLLLVAGIGDGQLAVYYLFRSHGSKRKQLHQIQGFDASRRVGDVATAVSLPSRRLLDDGSLAVETASRTDGRNCGPFCMEVRCCLFCNVHNCMFVRFLRDLKAGVLPSSRHFFRKTSSASLVTKP